MILGFAHLTATTANAGEERRRWLGRGWTESHAVPGVISATEKWPLMAGKACLHDLYMMNGDFWVEIVQHDTGVVQGDGRIAYRDGAGGCALGIVARNPDVEAAFFVDALSFAACGDGRGALTSRFPQWSIALSVTEDKNAPLDPPLDLDGLSCLAFYSTGVVEDAARIAACGGRDAIDPFEIRVKDRDLRILMLRSPEGTIIELIQVKKTNASLTQ